MSSQYRFPDWSAGQRYSQFDVFDNGRYFYSTQDNNLGFHPSGEFNYNVATRSRFEDVATITFTKTGAGSNFAPGSIVKINGIGAYNYTGMILNGNAGMIQYINYGLDDSAGAAGTINCLQPAWSTGFLFQPTYTSKVATQNNAIIAQLGEGYSQRQPNGINTFTQSINLVYQDRSKREARAISNYIEDHAGSYAFEILLPDPFLNNQPNQKWIAGSVDVTPVSFGLYDFQTTITRVFDA